MIRNETEYKEALVRIRDARGRLDAQRHELRHMGLSEEEIKRVIDPMESFHSHLAEEVESYERLCRGEFGEFINLHGIGQFLIGLRIAKGLNQRQLAERLAIHESQVSRDERNEYHGITMARASRILDVLGVRLATQVQNAGMEPVGS